MRSNMKSHQILIIEFDKWYYIVNIINLYFNVLFKMQIMKENVSTFFWCSLRVFIIFYLFLILF